MRIARKAEKSDLEALGRIEENAFADLRRRQSIELSVNEGLCWIMFDGKQEAGFLTIDLLTESECHIGLIAVHSSFKKKGIASFLVKFILQEYKGRSFFATTTKDNNAMINIFEKCGFKRVNGCDASELIFRKN